jgi:metal-responsive CopG/Arc/MetJ family transcriptional regulator
MTEKAIKTSVSLQPEFVSYLDRKAVEKGHLSRSHAIKELITAAAKSEGIKLALPKVRRNPDPTTS